MNEIFTIKLEGTEETQKALENVIPAGLHDAIGKGAADKVRGHLKSLDSTRANKLGGKRSHFYWEASENVTSEATVSGATIIIDKVGLRQRWQGGDIYPVNAKKLAIPARSESYGIPPKEFPGDLQVIKFKSGAMALVKDEQTHTVDQVGNYKILSAVKGQRKSRKRTLGLVEYWLVDHVHQSADPSVLPSPEDLLNAATQAAGEYMEAYH